MKWILLRGLTREARHWGEFPQILVDEQIAEAAYSIDAPGSGLKNDQISPFDITSYVKYMRPEFQMLRRQHPGPWGILGISMGAMIAMKWMELYPQDFANGVLINTSASNFSSPLKRLSLRTIKSIGGLFFNKSLEDREKFVYQITTHLESSDELTKVAEWVKIARENPISKASFMGQLIAAARFKAPRSLTVPTLFLVSEKDQLADSECGKKLAAHFRSPLHLHPEAGHDLPLDDAKWVCQKISEFINKH
jgi:pimeloyl-[acyl-carrier protein] methyl ester esterase